MAYTIQTFDMNTDNTAEYVATAPTVATVDALNVAEIDRENATIQAETVIKRVF